MPLNRYTGPILTPNGQNPLASIAGPSGYGLDPLRLLYDVPTAVAYPITASGGVQTGGAAVISTTKAFAGDGGVALGGAAPVAVTTALVASGGVVLGGEAGESITYSVEPSGGVVLGGEAGTDFIVPQTYEFVGDGGVVLSGSAAVAKAAGEDRAPATAVGGGSPFADGYVVSMRSGVSAPKKRKSVSAVAEGGVSVGGSATVSATHHATGVSPNEWLASPGKTLRRRPAAVKVGGGATVRVLFSPKSAPAVIGVGGGSVVSAAFRPTTVPAVVSIGGGSATRYVEDLTEILLLAA